MDVVKLRTLTGKSKLNFGKFSGMYVQQIIDLNEWVYLRWIYYCINGITFSEDILAKICIQEKDRIEKPGVAPEHHKKLVEELQSTMMLKRKIHVKTRMKYRAKAKLGKTMRSVSFSKGELQAINHGKI